MADIWKRDANKRLDDIRWLINNHECDRTITDILTNTYESISRLTETKPTTENIWGKNNGTQPRKERQFSRDSFGQDGAAAETAKAATTTAPTAPSNAWRPRTRRQPTPPPPPPPPPPPTFVDYDSTEDNNAPCSKCFEQRFRHDPKNFCDFNMKCRKYNCYYKHNNPYMCLEKDCNCIARRITKDIPDELPKDRIVLF